MIATAGLRPWIRRAAVLAALLAAAGLGLGLAEGPAGASGGGGLAQAKKDLLVKSDLPSGWSGQGGVTAGSGGGSFPGASQLAACLGVSAALIDNEQPNVTSPNFQNASGTDYVQDNVTKFASARLEAQEYAALASPKVPSCMTAVLRGPARQQIQQSAGSNVTIGTVTVTPTDPSLLAPHTTGFTMSFPATSQGVTLNSVITLVSMTRGRYGSQVTFTSVGQPFPAALERHLVGVAYGRT